MAASMVAAASATMAGGAAASIPPPGMAFDRTTFYDGPGLLCFSGFSIQLAEGEFAVLRKETSTSGRTQIELADARLQVWESFSGSPSGREVRAVGAGRLLLRRDQGLAVYAYDDGLAGVTEISGTSLRGGSRDTLLLDRINFTAPLSGVTECLPGVVTAR